MAGQKRATGRSRTAKSLKVVPDAPVGGLNVARVTALLESLRTSTAMSTRDETLGQVALTLAAALDEGMGMATAAVSKELRATIADLMGGHDDGDDDGWTAGLSSAVRHSKEP